MRPPRHSEIFEAYAKLSEEKGLIKKAAEEKKDKESKELKNYRSEVYPRVGSDDVGVIEALYGLKLECIPGMEYNENLVEVAHPQAVIISPSYDKLNGLVENINERHNIMVNKVMSKAPSGSVFLLKDAHKELTMELVRIGNDMDNADEDELRVLSDDCLEELNKQAGSWWDDAKSFVSEKISPVFGPKVDKGLGDVGSVGKGVIEGAAAGALTAALITAWAPPAAAVGVPFGALAGGALGGLSAWLFNTGSKVKNIKENSISFLAQLKDLEDSIPEQRSFFEEIKVLVANIVKSSDEYMALLETIRKKENQTSVSPAEIDSVKKTADNFIELITKFDKIHKDFTEKDRMGQFAKALNNTPALDNDIEDVENEFLSLGVAIGNLKSTMGKWSEKAVAEAKKIKDQKPEEKAHAPAAKKEVVKDESDKKAEEALSPFGLSGDVFETAKKLFKGIL